MSDAGDGRRLSRRNLLLGMGTVGVIGSGGSETVAVINDDDRFESVFSAGSLDLLVSWDDNSTEVDLGTLQEPGATYQRRVSVATPDGANPAYVWFRTNCPRCTEIEQSVLVSFEIETGTDTELLFDGTLREARAFFGAGRRLDEVLRPGQPWEIVVTWELAEAVNDETVVDFGFDFHAVQARHVTNPERVAPDWRCNGGCPSGESKISWVAFGGTDAADTAELEFSLADGGTTLMYDLGNASESVNAIALKYGTALDVFDAVQSDGSLTAGTGETYQQQSSAFPDAEPTRSNDAPFPEYCWTYKYEIDAASGKITSRCHR